MFEVVIQTNDLRGFDESDKCSVSEILLDGILGEEERMQYICSIEIVDEFEDQYKKIQSYIKDMHSHIKGLISSRG